MGFFKRLQLALQDASDEDAEIILAAFASAEDTPTPDAGALNAGNGRHLARSLGAVDA